MADNDEIEHGNKRQKVESSEQQQRAAYSEDMQRIRSTLNESTEKDDGEPSADNKSKDKEVWDKDSESKHQLSESREQQRMVGSDEEEDNDKWLKNYNHTVRGKLIFLLNCYSVCSIFLIDVRYFCYTHTLIYYII